MRIAVAHDSPALTAALARILGSVAGWRVPWTATTGDEAMASSEADPPDVLLMKVPLPGLDAVEAIRRIVARAACPVVVLTDPREAATGRVFEAMGAGAVDAVPAPSVGPEGDLQGGEAVVAKVRTASRLAPPAHVSTHAAAPSAPRHAAGRGAPLMVAIAASTGGPAALVSVLGALPPGFRGTVVAVQHVDMQFSADLAAWLGRQVRLPIRLARPGDRPAPGHVLLAGTNRDLAVADDGSLDYRRPRDGSFYHPSADVLFESLAAHWPDPGVAALLTGIGRDGARGMLALRRKGWHTIAQDEATSVVYGMPRAAAELDAAAVVLPIGEIGPAIVRYAAAGPQPR